MYEFVSQPPLTDGNFETASTYTVDAPLFRLDDDKKVLTSKQ